MPYFSYPVLNGCRCSECGAVLPLMVCSSAAGYYLGYFCDNCGPYSRESGYYRTRQEAENALAFITGEDE